MSEGAGKGDTPRPKSISEKEYQKRYDDAFGQKPYWFETKKHKKWLKEAEKIKQQENKNDLKCN